MKFRIVNFRKSKSMLLFLLVVGLLTPLVIISFSLESFDNRSKASNEILPEKFKIADLNGNNKVDAEDFTVWSSHFTKFLKQNTYYHKVADLDGDKKIGIQDFEKWFSLFNEYQVWLSSNGNSGDSGISNVKVTALASHKYLHIVSVGEFVVPDILVTPKNATSNDLLYTVDKPNVLKLVDNKNNPNKLMIGVSEGDARVVVSSKSNPSVKIVFFMHVVKRRALSLDIGESYQLNGYGVAKWKQLGAPGNIILADNGLVTGKKRGTALIAGMSGNKELVRIYIGIDLLEKPTKTVIPAIKSGTPVSGYMLKDTNRARKATDTNKIYTLYQKIFLEDYLTQKVEAVGGFGTRGGRNYQTLTGSKQGSRAGAVAAARFLALEFQYKIPYANNDFDGKVHTKAKNFDFGNWIYSPDWYNDRNIKDLYGYKLNIHDANDNSTGKGCWGCATGGKVYIPVNRKIPAFVEAHGLHCNSFVTWALYNSGLNVYYGMKASNMMEGLTYMASKQPGAQYIELFDINNNPMNVTEEQWKKVKVGDLIYYAKSMIGAHIGMIIGIDHTHKHMFIANQALEGITVERINYMKPQNPKDFGNTPWQKIILMDNVYEKSGYISSMW